MPSTGRAVLLAGVAGIVVQVLATMVPQRAGYVVGTALTAGVAAVTAAGDAPVGASEQVLERWMRWRHKVPEGPVTVTYQWPIGVALAVALVAVAVAVALS